MRGTDIFQEVVPKKKMLAFGYNNMDCMDKEREQIKLFDIPGVIP